jgi:hypothetical protein
MGSVKDIFVKVISDSKSKLLLAGASIILLLVLLNHWNYKRYKEAKQRIEIP